MKIQRLAFGMDFIPALNAIARQEELWRLDTIVLRDTTAQGLANWFNFDMLPDLRQYIFALMSRVNGEVLGPVVVRRMEQGSTLEFQETPHQHYVLVMHATSGGLFFSLGSEQMLANPGDAFWVAPHGTLVNNSQGEVIILHVQLTPNSPATYVPA